MKNRELRSGYTTGACAAAAAKAAALLALQNNIAGAGCLRPGIKIPEVDIPLPDGERATFRIHGSGATDGSAWASIIKDGGDDPDITHGAEIMAEARIVKESKDAYVGARCNVPVQIIINGGKGVGRVTKPGLPVPIGEPAINPVPRQMIEEAVSEALKDSAEAGKRESGKAKDLRAVEITIIVPNGEELAKKTLNARLGIVGGISILGTTGIVKPVSAEAWKATISSSMDVARAMGYKEVVLSAGRTSERAHMKKYNLPEESYVLMGDHLEYSLLEAKRHGFARACLCAQWAKMLKIAMATPQTHVRFGAIDTKKAVEFLSSLNIKVEDRDFNTAREIFDHITEKYAGARCSLPFQKVCKAAKEYAEKTGGLPVAASLVSYDGKVIESCE